jgi:signal transduction histidine kinase
VRSRWDGYRNWPGRSPKSSMKKTLWRGSTLQSLAVIILPLTILLVAISLVSYSIHQNAMRSVVGERDQRSAESAASAIESEINHRIFAIRSLALLVSSNPQESPDLILSSSKSLMGVFDYGTAFFQQDGTLLAVSGDHSFWQTLSGTAELASVLDPAKTDAISAVFISPVNNKLVVLVASRIEGDNRTAVGAFSPDALILSTLQNIYKAGGETAVYVIDPTYRVLYHTGPATLESAPESHPGVSEAFNGQSGTTYMKVGSDEHVVAYSPITTVGWAIVTEESWQLVSNPTLSTSQMIPLVLVPALLLAMLALWFGANQIVRPLQKLESKAGKLAWGDFQEIEKSVGGIAEIRDLQDELVHMARQLQAAQKSLHSYIGAITKGQEAERLRLARELHDDTIQSLIALKQRVQLVGMSHGKSSPAPELRELEILIEKTIDDLRRMTRALRPIYLEDLGLVAALEMLVREISQSSGLAIEFSTSGSERRLPPDVELALYRMVQEGLNNALHHTQATHISVKMEFKSRATRLEITDNGKGFEVPKTPAEFTPQGHFGLLGLYERAELIGAHLEITSSPGKGTRLSIDLPFSK